MSLDETHFSQQMDFEFHEVTCLDSESIQYLHQMKTCDREGLPAPAMAAIFSIVSGGDDGFLAAFVVGGNAETNTEKQ